ncbi:MAG: hypothetical protein ACRBBV_11305 [Paracoccaceae bacterium]
MKRALKMMAPGWARLGPNDRAELWLELRQVTAIGTLSAFDAYLDRYEGVSRQ